jgi:hypothetical protein
MYLHKFEDVMACRLNNRYRVINSGSFRLNPYLINSYAVSAE